MEDTKYYKLYWTEYGNNGEVVRTGMDKWWLNKTGIEMRLSSAERKYPQRTHSIFCNKFTENPNAVVKQRTLSCHSKLYPEWM